MADPPGPVDKPFDPVIAFGRNRGAGGYMMGAKGNSASVPRFYIRHLSAFLLFFLFLITAEASYSGFYEKWGLKDGADRYSVPLMVDGTATKPFVYRQLMPMTANVIEDALPQGIKAKLLARLVRPSPENPGRTNWGMRQGDADNPRYAIRYYIIYNLTFFAFFVSLFLMRRLCLAEGLSPMAAVAAPVAFALYFPFFLSRGGHFYDFSELFFFVGAMCLCRTRLDWLLVPISTIATYDKELFFFFILCLAPLLVRDRKDIRGLAIFGGALLVSGLTYVFNKAQYAGNPGESVQFWLWGNLEYYVNPANLFWMERTYGLWGWSGYSLVAILLVAAVARLGWAHLGTRMKLHALLAAAINLPLFILFAHPGEVRSLNLLFPTLMLLIGGAVQTSMRAQTSPAHGA